MRMGYGSSNQPFVDAAGGTIDYNEAKLMLFKYIDVLWSEYVSCPGEELGETGRMQRGCSRKCL